MDTNELDRRVWLRQLPSYGPDWDAAIEFGIDVSLIEENLTKSHAERFRESVQMTQFANQLAAARESLYGPEE